MNANNSIPDRDARALETLTSTRPEHLHILHARLGTNADQAGLLDLAYRIVDTPVGRLMLASTTKGLVRVAYEREDFDAVLETLAAKISPRILKAPHRLEEPARQVEEYFEGTRHTFDVALDDALSTGFRRTVQQYLPHIEYGHTLTYKQVANLVGNPKAVRAVGTACATNPLPLVVPCHRVLRSDGGLGGYLGGVDAKETLLNLEQQTA